MSEKLTAKQAAEQLLYKPEYAADKSTGVKKEAAAFADIFYSAGRFYDDGRFLIRYSPGNSYD